MLCYNLEHEPLEARPYIIQTGLQSEVDGLVGQSCPDGPTAARIGLNLQSWQRTNVDNISRVRIFAQVDLNLLQEWIRRGVHHHTICRVLADSPSHQVCPRTLLIDVQQNCLVDANTCFGYSTLSCVWGQLSMFKTTVGELESLRVPNILTKIQAQLPRVIADSINIVRNIGEQYLWVDSLCNV